MDEFFKGWAKPGPVVPPPGLDGVPSAGPDETLDAISGYYRLFQLKDGHRFSTDDVLTAWYGSSWCPCARSVLDLGSGIGSVGMITAWRLQGARFVTVEAQERSVQLARKSARYNGIGDRYEIRHGDFRNDGVLRPEEKFDLITGSPPYFDVADGIVAEHPQKMACRFEARGTVWDYCMTASKHLNPGGVFACVFPVEPPQQAERVRNGAADAGLTIVRQRPVVFRQGRPPLIGLFLMTRSSDLPERMRSATWTEPELIIRRADGSIHPEYAAVKLSFGFPP